MRTRLYPRPNSPAEPGYVCYGNVSGEVLFPEQLICEDCGTPYVMVWIEYDRHTHQRVAVQFLGIIHDNTCPTAPRLTRVANMPSPLGTWDPRDEKRLV
jgi:hypothetical protein